MSEKNFNNIRIIHKHDTEENWLKAENFIPLKGELIIYDIDTSYQYSRMKIGDGMTNVNLLPFINFNSGGSDDTNDYATKEWVEELILGGKW